MSSYADQANEMKIMGCQSNTFFNIINALLGLSMSVFGILGIITLFGKLASDMPVIAVTFAIYEIFFGFLMVLAACNLQFIQRNFLFLTTVTGKGFFDLFLTSMFLVGHATLYAYLMAGLFGCCGIFFLMIGCCVKSVQIDDGLDATDAAAKEARKS